MKKITPALFKKIVKQVALEQTLETGKGYEFNVDECSRVDNGHTFKLVSVWLVRSKEFTVRVDFQQDNASVFVFSMEEYRHIRTEWSLPDLNVISRAVTLAAKILERVAEVKGSE